MKKWIVVGIVIILVMIWQTVDTYQVAIEPKQSGEEHAIIKAKEKVGLNQISNVSTYYGNKVYSVVKGMDDLKRQLIVWVPSKGEKMIVKEASEGISEQRAIQILQKRQNPKKIIKVVLGMEKKTPIWEITYIDQHNRYSFYYLDFESGKFIKRYSL